MRTPILVLSNDLASQIAAGEVVERPASVVKELVENALDAGATRIDVAIVGGGITSIEIADDGMGMTLEDAPLALGRHATSKLAQFSDLDSLKSYGFRGEALPSIASVSRLEIRTRGRESEEGVLLRAFGTTVPESEIVGHPVGTTLTVKDLFFNVPARRKFLKSTNTESGHVGEVLINAALSKPDVSFSLSRDGRRAKSFPRVDERQKRVEQVFEEEQLLAFRGERGPLVVEGFLSRPDRARQGASGLRILVNNRPVRDRALAATIAHAYGGSLERGRYPKGAIYLTLPERLVDVNVHPQKTEVRFAELRSVSDAIHSVVSRAIGAELTRIEPGPGERPTITARGSAAVPAAGGRVPARTQPQARVMRGAAPVSGQRYESAPGTGRAPMGAPAPSNPRAERVSPSPERPKKTWKSLRFLNQLRGEFLVCEGADALYILQQHAAEERVLLTQLLAGFSQGVIASQARLFPAVLELPPADCVFLEENAEMFHRLGFDVRVRSEHSVSIHAGPRLAHRASWEELVPDLILDLKRKGPEEALRTMACRGAVGPGDRLTREEAESLLRALSTANFEASCRHPDCVVSTTSWADLARKTGKMDGSR